MASGEYSVGLRLGNSTPEGSCPEAGGLGYHTPTCIIFGYHPTPTWRKGHWLRQLPPTESSPEKLAAVHASKLRGGCPFWFKGMGAGDENPLYGASRT